jgi:hypothetical protein
LINVQAGRIESKLSSEWRREGETSFGIYAEALRAAQQILTKTTHSTTTDKDHTFLTTVEESLDSHTMERKRKSHTGRVHRGGGVRLTEREEAMQDAQNKVRSEFYILLMFNFIYC